MILKVFLIFLFILIRYYSFNINDKNINSLYKIIQNNSTFFNNTKINKNFSLTSTQIIGLLIFN
jgi:hypothetical protein